MPRVCIVKGCASAGQRNGRNPRPEGEVLYPSSVDQISFHSFPAKPMVRIKWLENLGLDSVPHESAVVCSRHFTESCFKKESDKTRYQGTKSRGRPKKSQGNNAFEFGDRHIGSLIKPKSLRILFSEAFPTKKLGRPNVSLPHRRFLPPPSEGERKEEDLKEIHKLTLSIYMEGVEKDDNSQAESTGGDMMELMPDSKKLKRKSSAVDTDMQDVENENLKPEILSTEDKRKLFRPSNKSYPAELFVRTVELQAMKARGPKRDGATITYAMSLMDKSEMTPDQLELLSEQTTWESFTAVFLDTFGQNPLSMDEKIDFFNTCYKQSNEDCFDHMLRSQFLAEMIQTSSGCGGCQNKVSSEWSKVFFIAGLEASERDICRAKSATEPLEGLARMVNQFNGFEPAPTIFDTMTEFCEYDKQIKDNFGREKPRDDVISEVNFDLSESREETDLNDKIAEESFGTEFMDDHNYISDMQKKVQTVSPSRQELLDKLAFLNNLASEPCGAGKLLSQASNLEARKKGIERMGDDEFMEDLNHPSECQNDAEDTPASRKELLDKLSFLNKLDSEICDSKAFESPGSELEAARKRNINDTSDNHKPAVHRKYHAIAADPQVFACTEGGCISAFSQKVNLRLHLQRRHGKE